MTESEPARRPPLRVLNGEAYANWESVYSDNVVAVYRLVHLQVGNRADAEDLTEEVFMAALPRLRLPAPVRSVRAYLAATVRTVTADHWRRHYAAPPSVSFADGMGSDLLEPGEALPASDRAARVLGLLPHRFREILELRFLRGLSIRQAADEMGVTTGNARVLQHRALRRAAELAEELEP
ncbi:MAG TPA: sigma-70 family RNA polymerase sigma factor [Candidatus Dormibacteraeota bacterium]|nr:sigma-70 family RNA polymerase sigma factor [Candidatus Dormibacteraeota bacterium]